MDLILETSLSDIRAAIIDGSEAKVSRHILRGRGEVLDGTLTEMLEEGGLELDDIKRIMVTLGPGSFTGLRTGIAFAQGLCYSGHRTLYGVSTLAALAELAKEDADVLVVLKAKPGLYYCGRKESGDTQAAFLKHEGMVEEEELLASDSPWLKGSPTLVIEQALLDAEETLKSGLEAHCTKTVDFSELKLESFAGLWDALDELKHAKPNYLQKSYAEQSK